MRQVSVRWQTVLTFCDQNQTALKGNEVTAVTATDVRRIPVKQVESFECIKQVSYLDAQNVIYAARGLSINHEVAWGHGNFFFLSIFKQPPLQMKNSFTDSEI